MDDFVKMFRALIAIILVIVTAILAIRGVHGWGWFLFASIIAIP